MSDDTGHLLERLHRYNKETIYFRWLCSCGAIGGKRSTRDAAFADHERHVNQS